VEDNIIQDLPIVTIGLVTYNRTEMLSQAVNSILSQKFTNFQLLIGNDYIDKPVTFKSLGIDYDSRIKIFNYKKNIGEINNMNYLLSKAKTKWFTWFADDDIFHPYLLHSLIAALNCVKGNVSAVYSSYSAGPKLQDNFFYNLRDVEPVSYSAKKFIKKFVTREVDIIGCFGLMDTEKLKYSGGMPSLGSKFGPYSDTIIPIVLANLGEIIVVDMPLVFLRTHSKSLTASTSDLEAYSSAEPDFLKILKKVGLQYGDIRYVNDCIYNMIKWFSYNEFMIISRNNKISRVTVVYRYLDYQLKINYSRISPIYWFPFTISILNLVFKIIFNSLLKKIKSIKVY
jgi:glycosyltransferase involved in cell wall biosynthesis